MNISAISANERGRLNRIVIYNRTPHPLLYQRHAMRHRTTPQPPSAADTSPAAAPPAPRTHSTTQPQPQVGDTRRVRLSAGRRDAGATGIVTRVRVSSGRWTAAELEIADQRRWFLKGEMEVPPPPPPPRRVAPPADFLRIARRPRQGRPQSTLFLYLGRTLLARWQAAAGPVARVDVAMEDGRLTIRATPTGRYLLDARAGRQPSIHCAGARDLVTLPDGRYQGGIEGTALIVGAALAGEA